MEPTPRPWPQRPTSRDRLVSREDRTSMKLPDGWHCLTPTIVTKDVTGLVDFLRRAFNATGEVHLDRPAVMRIADSSLMISGAGRRPVMPAFLYVYVDDADRTYRRAVEAGARSRSQSTRRTATDAPWSKIDGATSGRSRRSRGNAAADSLLDAVLLEHRSQ
jgi:PhnB protein